MERPSVVLVEDHGDTLDLYGELLTGAGYCVRKAATADELFRLLEEETPAAIVMDLGLPDERGIDVCHRVRGRQGFARVPIIAITGWSSGSQLDGLDSAPFDEVLLKPIPPELLVRTLRLWVGRAETGPVGAPYLGV